MSTPLRRPGTSQDSNMHRTNQNMTTVRAYDCVTCSSTKERDVRLETPGTSALSEVCTASKSDQVVLGLRAIAPSHVSRAIAKQRAVASVEPSPESGHRLCSSYSHLRRRRGRSCRICSWIMRKPTEMGTRGVSILALRGCALKGRQPLGRAGLEQVFLERS